MSLIGTRMVSDGKTARQIFEDLMAGPARKPFGFGDKLAIVNVDFQNAYTRIEEFATSYETDPKQIGYTNQMSKLARAKGMPVIWTHVAYLDDGRDCGVWGTRSDTPDSLQNIKYGSRRYEVGRPLRHRCTPVTRSTPSACRRPSSRRRCAVC